MNTRRIFLTTFASLPFLGFLKPESKKSEPKKLKDTGLHTLFDFMKQNDGVFYFDKESDCFVLSADNEYCDEILSKNTPYCGFDVPKPEDDIENEFLKPAIAALGRRNIKKNPVRDLIKLEDNVAIEAELKARLSETPCVLLLDVKRQKYILMERPSKEFNVARGGKATKIM